MWAGWLDLDLDWNRKKKYPNMTNRTSPSQGMGTQAKPHSSQAAGDGYTWVCMHTAATELNCRHGIARMFVIFEHQISMKRTSESTIMPGIHARPFSCHSQAYLYYGIHWYYVDLIFDWFNMSHIIASEMKNLWLRDGSSENISTNRLAPRKAINLTQ